MGVLLVDWTMGVGYEEEERFFDNYPPSSPSCASETFSATKQ